MQRVKIWVWVCGDCRSPHNFTPGLVLKRIDFLINIQKHLISGGNSRHQVIFQLS